MDNISIEGIYFYEVGYGSCEDSGSIQLYHTTAFSKDEFTEMVKQCSVKPAKDELENQLNYCARREMYDAALDSSDPRFGRKHLPNVQFDSIYAKVAEQLCTIYGFLEVEYKEQVYFFGWSNLMAEESWTGHVGVEDKAFAKFLQKELNYSIPKDEDYL